LAKKTGDSSTTGTSRAHSNKRSRKDKHSNGAPYQGAGFVQHNSYAMEVDKGRNCYSCGGFGHLA